MSRFNQGESFGAPRIAESHETILDVRCRWEDAVLIKPSETGKRISAIDVIPSVLVDFKKQPPTSMRRWHFARNDSPQLAPRS
jgi:hypothetical protein